MMNSRIKVYVTLLAFIVLLAIIIGRNYLYKYYIHVFKKNVIIENFDNQGRHDGELIAYVNGRVYGKAGFVHGLKNGEFLKYFDNGQLNEQCFYTNDKLNGVENVYYNNGNLNYTNTWVNGKKAGNTYHYLANKQLANYDVFFNDELFCYVTYTDGGKAKQILGNVVLPHVYIIGKNDSTVLLKDGLSYQGINEFYLSTATPPKLDVDVKVWVNNNLASNIVKSGNTIKVKNAFSLPGNYSIRVIGKLIDSDKNIRKTDTIQLNIQKVL